jgi:hypothetical protein
MTVLLDAADSSSDLSDQHERERPIGAPALPWRSGTLDGHA